MQIDREQIKIYITSTFDINGEYNGKSVIENVINLT